MRPHVVEDGSVGDGDVCGKPGIGIVALADPADFTGLGGEPPAPPASAVSSGTNTASLETAGAP
ncbi:hypothetical protein [Natronococcus wangiae]|uniref:hypothetical protein n=1 Tax=Natronococcus wangiae TaxID=3068275 RepID=UPI00273D7B9A|nr:hypothetical protein [Natronococcus sp. AD5]